MNDEDGTLFLYLYLNFTNSILSYLLFAKRRMQKQKRPNLCLLDTIYTFDYFIFFVITPFGLPRDRIQNPKANINDIHNY